MVLGEKISWQNHKKERKTDKKGIMKRTEGERPSL